MILSDLPNDHQLSDLKRALSFVKVFNVAVDIGAHRGILTSVLCEQFECVHSFEPTDLAHKIDQRALVHKMALGPNEGFCAMQPGKTNSGQTYVVSGEDTRMNTLDSFGLKPSFIKIDVEGYEVPVLHGARETIIRSRPVIMFEDNGLCERYGYQMNDCAALLRSWGMKEVAVLSKWQRGADYVYAF